MSPKEAAADNGEEILIVEDSPTQAKYLKYMLEKDGYQVLVADSAKEALASLKKHKTKVVIADVFMPEMNGIELLGKIKEQSPETEVIIVTAHGKSELVDEALQKGAFDYITKPIEPAKLSSAISRALKKH